MKKFLAAALFLLAAYATSAQAAEVVRPFIYIDSPSQVGEEPEDGSFKISVGFRNVRVGDTWTIYALSDAQPATFLMIAEGIPTTVRQLHWDMGTLSAGTYNLFAVLRSGGTVVTATSLGNIAKD